MSDKELDGRVAVVTGAGRNIGRAIALQLAAGGAAVVVNVRRNQKEADSVVKEIESAGGYALAAIGDVADAAAMQRMAAVAAERFGRIDYLINNAALRHEKPLDQMTFAEWREVLGVVLDGAFHCVKTCLAHLRKSGAGAIVNIGGMSAHTGSKNRIHVTTAKAGLVGMTRGLAHDLAADNITVNYLSPGLIGTPRDPSQPEPQHHSIHHTLSGKRGVPDDVATMVRFLCGPGARYITGQSLHANGGAFLG
ncbi:MAG: SDR family oxidoreductase [Rhizobiales bacterium]|nr:SDR family oxidoreductase [Hyphomicrobiales bacterium]